MTPQKQLFGHDPTQGVYGDCARACVACLLDLPIEDVPHFAAKLINDPDGNFNEEIEVYLLLQGIAPISIAWKVEDLQTLLDSVSHNNKNIYYTLTGTSRTKVNHEVICLNNKIVFDPSLTDSGIVGPCADGFYWTTFFTTTRFMA